MRILLADDSALLAEAFRALLERLGHEVLDPVNTADALVTRFTELHTSRATPDLVITDVRMPPTMRDDGLLAAHRIRGMAAGQPVLVLSQYIADSYARELLTLPDGAVGYLLKDRVNRVADFARAVSTIQAGGTVIDPDVVQHLLRAGSSPLDSLSPREREVLGLMAQGRSNGEIAAELFLSDAAVGKHIGNIFARLGLTPSDENRRVKAILLYLGTAPRI